MTKILVAVGHGRRPDGSMDPGATAGTKTEQTEGQRIVAVANACADRLRQATPVRVRVVEAGGPNWSGAASIANRWGADYALEVHHDWRGAPRGAFGHWHSSNRAGKAWADAMLARVTALGYESRPAWHRARDGLGWLRSTSMTAVLWECDRIGTVTDPTAYGRALADGTLEHLGMEATDEEWLMGYTPDDVVDALLASRVRDGMNVEGRLHWAHEHAKRANRRSEAVADMVEDLLRAVEGLSMDDRDAVDAAVSDAKEIARTVRSELADALADD